MPDSDLNNIDLPDFKNWKSSQLYDYANQITDYQSLKELGESINAARIALFKVTDQINRYERLERKARINYERSFRREFLASTERTDSLRKNRAALICEELENNFLEYEQMKNELLRLSAALRLELQTMQTVGNNMRQQLKME